MGRGPNVERKKVNDGWPSSKSTFSHLLIQRQKIRRVVLSLLGDGLNWDPGKQVTGRRRRKTILELKLRHHLQPRHQVLSEIDKWIYLFPLC
jgi:hypothetical protein